MVTPCASTIGLPERLPETVEANNPALATSWETCTSSDILDGGDAKRLYLKSHLLREAPKDGVDQNALLSVGSGFNNDNPDTTIAQSNGFLLYDPIEDESLGLFAVPHESPESLEDPEPLEDAIRRCTQVSSGKDDSRPFLPVDELDKLITYQAVYRNLHLAFSHKDAKELSLLAHEVCDEIALSPSKSGALTTRKRIFATLVLINQVVAIGDFIQEGLYDMHLPFYLPDQKLDLHGDVYRLSNPEEDNTKIPIPLFSGWKSLERENFEKYQWQFLAPFFDVMSGENSRPLHYVLEDSRILPFIEDLEGKGPEPVISGGYSEVWRVKIHPAHHSNSSQTNPDFAVKRLRPSDRSLETFKREVATLKRLSRQDHLYLMRLQLTYLWRGNYHLLFDWADGNLKNFWEMHPSPGDIPRSHEFAIWVAEQLLGLTQGLKAIHSCPPDLALEDGAGEDEYAAERTRGRHGDLKPENILWFKQNQQFQCNDNQPHHLGRLVISDFGLTQFHRLVTGRVDPVNVARTPTYRPPEYDIGDEITQSFDIWTWGCVLLEFSIWYLKGFKAWDGFSRERTEEHKSVPFKEDVYFSVETKAANGQTFPSAKLKKSVVKQYARLRDDPKISQFLVDVLDLIELKLLRMHPDERATCDQVVEKLKTIHEKCIRSKEYSVEPIPGTKPNRVYTDASEFSVQPTNDRPEMDSGDSDVRFPPLVDEVVDRTSNDTVQSPPATPNQDFGHNEKVVKFAQEDTNKISVSTGAPKNKTASPGSDDTLAKRQGHPELQPSTPTNEPLELIQHQSKTAGLQPVAEDLSQQHLETRRKETQDDGKDRRKWWHIFICGFCSRA